MGRENCPNDAGYHKHCGQAAKSGHLGISEAPVYYPSEEEFKDPLAYIEKIRKEAEAYGICKIIPPKRWRPPFTIDRKTFTFPTKLQAIHHLQMRPAAHDVDTFKLEYTRFLEREGHKIGRWPTFRGKDLDLCQFFSAVKRHGGHQKVTKDKKWGEVLQILDPSYKLASQSESLQSMLREMYETHLYAYEVYLSKLTGRKRNRSMSDLEGRNTLREQKLQKVTFSATDLSDVDCKENVSIKGGHVCEQCHSGAHEQSMLLCDRCDRVWHLYCLTPPLESVPPGSWYCFDCLASETESFGFTTGQVHNFDSFRQAAKRFKKKWFGGRKDLTYAEVEEEFWSVVERCKGPVEVLYGSDLASEVYGSGFPRSSDRIPSSVDKDVWNDYVTSPWNLNNFPKLAGSVLKHVQENIPGVTVPWVYMGMLFSSFCWHYEDQCFYSINYVHWGEPKCWYGVPGSAVDAFEQIMHKTFPDLFEAQPDLLFQLVTMLNPKVLRENDVPVYTTIQERGNFVITFPRSYHGGFNLGLNCAEAVNFATLDWLPFGHFGVERARLYHKAAVISQEEILCVVAKNAQSYGKSSSWLREELEYVIRSQQKQRMTLWQNGIVRSSRMLARKFPDVIGTEEDPECVICKYYLFISAVTCSCNPKRVVCLQHSEHLCECSKDQQQLLYRYSLAELAELLSHLDSYDCANDELGENQRNGCRQSDVLGAPKNLKQAKGSAIAYAKIADAWCQKADKLLGITPKLLDVESLLKEAEQFLWAGHEMNTVRSLEKRLRSMQSWAQGVVSCLASSGVKLEGLEETSEKPSLAAAKELLSIKPAPCDLEKSLLKLEELVESAVSMQEKLRALFSSGICLEIAELEGLQQRLFQSPFKFPEAEKLDDLVKTTHVWRKKVQSLFREPRMRWISGRKNGTNMDTLHTLQAEAERLFVLLPEKKILDAYVRKLEKWQERAKSLVDQVLSVQDIENFLSEVESVPVYFEEAEILEKRIYEVSEWTRSVYKVIADVQQQKYYKASMQSLCSLIKSGERLNIKVVKEMEYLTMELKRVSWLERASKGLQGHLSRTELSDFLKEARSLSLENENVYLALCQVLEDAEAWEVKVSKCLQDGAYIDDFKGLRRDASKISANLSGWKDINLQLMQAESFLHHAQPFMDRQFLETDGTLNFDNLQELVNQTHSFKIDLPERKLLGALLQNIKTWKEKALELINHSKDVLQASDLAIQSCKEVPAEDVNIKAISGMDSLLNDLSSMVDEGNKFGFELPERDTLQVLAAATEWIVKLTSIRLENPSIEEVDHFLQEARSFQDYFSQFDQLQSVVSKAKEWSFRLRTALDQKEPELKCSLCDLENLLFEAKALGLGVFSDVTYLEELLAFYKAWQKQISRCLHSPAQAISWKELHQLQNIGKSSQIRFDDAEILDKEVAMVEAWLSKCLLKLLGQSELSSMPLMDALLKVQASVDIALQQLRKRAYIEGDEVCMEDGICHLCKKFVDYAISNHLKCDSCNDRFHRSCLTSENYQDWVQSQFVCSFCNAFNAGVLLLDENVLSKICITKRPTLSALQDLLEAAAGLRFRLKEVELLDDIIEAVQEWENCLQQVVEPILRSQSSHSFSSSVLLSALKIAGTMEVQGDGKCQLALALSVNAWRMQAKGVMESMTKPSYRTVCRILKEGLAIPFLAHDCVLKDLKTWETIASVWVSQAQMAIEDDGVMPVEDVFKLIMEGEKLPVAFTKELADLKSRTSLYCICRKPYDKERGMIACDSCSEWYHFDCVGLREPDSGDEGCLDMLQRCGSAGEFLCPNCKNIEIADSTNLITQLQEDICVPMKFSDICGESVCTPPLWYARGKRSNRVSGRVRADLRERWQNHTSIMYCPKASTKGADCSDQTAIISASGRPCRRTAGQNSRFESFVLLMHSG